MSPHNHPPCGPILPEPLWLNPARAQKKCLHLLRSAPTLPLLTKIFVERNIHLMCRPIQWWGGGGTFPDLKLFDRTVSSQVSAKEVANMATCPSIHSTFLLQLKSWSSANVRAQDCPKQDSQVDGMGNLCFSYLLSPIWHLPGLSSLLMDCHKTLQLLLPWFWSLLC